MRNLNILEITENDYCIKLKKEEFDLGLLRKLIHRIQNEQSSFKKEHYEDDIISKAGNSLNEENFDRLTDK